MTRPNNRARVRRSAKLLAPVPFLYANDRVVLRCPELLAEVLRVSQCTLEHSPDLRIRRLSARRRTEQQRKCEKRSAKSQLRGLSNAAGSSCVGGHVMPG